MIALLAAACSQAAAPAARPRPSASPPSAPALVAMPPPSVHPNYPPQSLADLAALAGRGVDRRVGFTEAQPLDLCSMGWTMILEPAGTSPEQEAADLMRMAVKKGFLYQTCGGNLFGSTDITYCNCYRGDHGVLYLERGPSREPSPGMMQVVFWVHDGADTPGDWRLTVPAPARP